MGQPWLITTYSKTRWELAEETHRLDAELTKRIGRMPKHPSRRNYLNPRETRNTWIAAAIALALGCVGGEYAGQHLPADIAGRVFWLITMFSLVGAKVALEWRYLKVGTTAEMERAGLSVEELANLKKQFDALSKAQR